MTKEYPKKMKFFRFKQQRNPNQEQAPAPSIDQPEIAQTPEQAQDSQNRSIARSRRELADLIDCNDFDKFATLTFDPKKHPLCNDYQYAKRIVIRWLGNQKRLHGDFRYVLVMEPQKNGNTHFHAVLGGFTGKYYATNIRGNGKTARQCYKIDSWEKNYGFADMEEIGNKSAVAQYIGKYLAKDVGLSITGKGEKRYYASRNLLRPVKAYNTELETLTHSGNYDLAKNDVYENDYIEVTTLNKK